MAAFELAVEMGVDLLECDVHFSRDGVPVVVHDETLDRTTTGSGFVRDQDAPSLVQLGLPRLDELLRWCKDRIPLEIELKHGPPEPIVDLVRRHDLLGHTYVISFDHTALRRVKELEPRLGGAILYSRQLPDPIAAARGSLADGIAPHHRLATPELVAAAHAAGLAVGVWTVDDVADLPRLVAAGVDAIATNYPDRIIAALG